ncbi:hypothetical protein ACXYMX_03480 [Sporosarcina sp. CAU 1771]
MGEVDKVKAFSELYDLMVFYSENRDQPVAKGFDFFKNVELQCDLLGLDFEEFKKEFNLNKGGF